MTAPIPPEVREAAVVEEVARAIWAEALVTTNVVEYDADEETWQQQREDRFRRLAVAAVAAYRAQDRGAEEADRRWTEVMETTAKWVKDWRGDGSDFDQGYQAGVQDAAAAIHRGIRAALAPQAGEGAR